MTWQSIPGFSGDIEAFYADLAKTLPQGARFVEVGVLFGRSIACLGTLRPDLDLWAVDTWEQGDREGEMAEYQARFGSTWMAFLGGMTQYAPEVLERLHVVRALSTEAVIPNLDGVFIDAGHSYEDARDDIKHWGRFVKPGGVLSGHDYLFPNHPGVVQAVDEAFGPPPHTMGPGDWTSVWIAKNWTMR
jgi:SAM-dependent methyltransferase